MAELLNGAKGAAARKPTTRAQALDAGAGDAAAQRAAVESLRLERVLGSGAGAAGVVAAQHPVVPGLLAYTAGASVVLYDSHRKQQTAFLCPKRRSGSSGRPYKCLAFSRDGTHLAAGEGGGTGTGSPEVLVWEVSSGKCVQALRGGHKHGVCAVAFGGGCTDGGRLLLSAGEGYDGNICVWDWAPGSLLAKQHTQAELVGACFLEDAAAGGGGAASVICTVGKAGHCKMWTLALPTGRAGGYQTALAPRPANIKDYRGSALVSVAAAEAGQAGVLYALTQTGFLLTLRAATRTLDKSLNLQVPAAFALAVSPALVACACAAGVVRLFAAKTLAYKGLLPRPSTSSSHAAADGEAADGARGASALYPDAVGCSFDCTGDRLTVVYSDRTMVVWDVRNPTKAVPARSVLSHSSIIWSAAVIPSWQASLLGTGTGVCAPTPMPGDGRSGAPAAPASVLCTCGADGTVRLWNVCLDAAASTAGPSGVPPELVPGRITRTLRAIIHATPPAAAGVSATAAARCGPNNALPPPGASAAPRPGASVVLRCLRVSPCGRFLATGDSRGNIRVFSLVTLELLLMREAHDAEVLCLDYSPPAPDGRCFLASGSRDMLVHVYDVSRGYELCGTCDAHGGAVTAVRFSASGRRLALISASADKAVVFRHCQLGPAGMAFTVYNTNTERRGVLYDLAVDASGGRAVAVGQDGLRVMDVATGRGIRNFAGDPTCGEAVSVAVDPAGHLAVCGCADGTVAVYDLDACCLLARATGHAEMCTSAVLLDEYRGVISVGGDGCALLWRLTPRLARRMQDAAAQVRRQLEQQAALVQHAGAAATPAVVPRRKGWAEPSAAGKAAGEGGDGHEDVFVDTSATLLRIREGKPLMSVDKLPPWAQRLYGPGEAAPQQPTTSGGNGGAAAPAPAGKWAQRMAPPPAPSAAAAAPSGPAAAGAGAGVASAVAATLPAAVAARVEAIAVQPRTWIAAEDDEICLCVDEDMDDGALEQAGAPRFAVCQDAGAADEAEEASRGASPSRGREALASADQATGADAAPEVEPPSACASNGHGAAPQPADAGDEVKRDLFREHFDSLGLDQGSTTKRAPVDPRRQSLSFMYRQARAATEAHAASPPRAAPPASPLPPPQQQQQQPAGASGEAATAVAPTPYIARIPLPAGINVTRGTRAVCAEDADGGITSAAWTPERAMLPLTSPALAKTDNQLAELERLKQRLANTLRKRRPEGDGSAPEGDGTAPGTACAACPAPAPVAPTLAAAQAAAPAAALPQTAPPAAAPQAQPAPAVAPSQPAAPQPAGSVVTFAPAAAAASARSPPRSPPPRSPPTGPAQVAETPGFSSLSEATPLLGPSMAPAPASGLPGTNAYTLVENPMFATTPATPTLRPPADAPAPAAAAEASVVVPAGTPGAAAGTRLQPDAVIRTLLEEQAGVCVVAAALPSTAPPVAPAEHAGGQKDAQRRPKPALPMIKPKPMSPAKALLGGRERCDEPQATAVQQAPVAVLPAAASAPAAAQQGEQEAAWDGVVSRMQASLADFAAAYQEVHAAAAASGAALPPGLSRMAQQYRQATSDARALLGGLGGSMQQAPSDGRAPAPLALPPPPPPASSGNGSSGRVSPVRTRLDSPNACASPRASVSTQQPGAGLPAAAAAAGSALQQSGCSVGASHVVLDVGLMESLVHERMKEELKRVEEAMVARIMQSMLAQQQQQLTS